MTWGPVSSAHSTTARPVRAFADIRAEVPKKKENSTPACTGLHQEGWGLARISVDDSCLEFGPADSQIILRPFIYKYIHFLPLYIQFCDHSKCILTD